MLLVHGFPLQSSCWFARFGLFALLNHDCGGLLVSFALKVEKTQQYRTTRINQQDGWAVDHYRDLFASTAGLLVPSAMPTGKYAANIDSGTV